MLSILAKLEHKIGDKVFHFLCPSDAPTSEVKEALMQFTGHVVAIEKAAAEKLAAEEAAKSPAEASVVVPDAVEVPSKVESING